MNTEKPLFTVITVVYNCADSIEQTIRSVLSQTCSSMEYIIVDGGSTDGTLEIIDRYKDSVSKFVSKPDRGIYDAMNRGIAMAEGLWINFMNSGDTFTDPSVLTQVKEFIEAGDYDIIYGDIYELFPDGTQHRKEAEHRPASKHRMFFCHQASFVKTEILREIGFDIRYRMSADLKFFKQCYNKKYRFGHMPIQVAIFDKKGISSRKRDLGLMENIRVVNELDRSWARTKSLIRLWFTITYIRKIRRHTRRDASY